MVNNYNILIVSVSKDEQFRFNESDFNGIPSNINFDFKWISNNKDGLPKVYNRILKEFRNKYDFIVFSHSDIKMDFTHFINHLIECKDKYDVFGLCGCAKVDTSASPFNWYCSSNKYPNFRWGCVTHGEMGNAKSFFSSDRSETTDHAVGCIDGLCIVFGKNALNSELSFDEIFLFDLYDSQISFDAILTYHLRLGVLVEESLYHYSVGKSILSEDFLRHEKDFRKKFNLEIPPHSPIRRLKD